MSLFLDQPCPPDVIGSYRLGDAIASGGMGAVYRATHVVLPRPLLCLIELPLPQIPGLAAKDIRIVPFATRATLLAMLCVLACGDDPGSAPGPDAAAPDGGDTVELAPYPGWPAQSPQHQLCDN